jgi:hypothetical protein
VLLVEWLLWVVVVVVVAVVTIMDMTMVVVLVELSNLNNLMVDVVVTKFTITNNSRLNLRFNRKISYIKKPESLMLLGFFILKTKKKEYNYSFKYKI